MSVTQSIRLGRFNGNAETNEIKKKNGKLTYT